MLPAFLPTPLQKKNWSYVHTSSSKACDKPTAPLEKCKSCELLIRTFSDLFIQLEYHKLQERLFPLYQGFNDEAKKITSKCFNCTIQQCLVYHWWYAHHSLGNHVLGYCILGPYLLPVMHTKLSLTSNASSWCWRDFLWTQAITRGTAQQSSITLRVSCS
jgi:hypothetical protein